MLGSIFAQTTSEFLPYTTTTTSSDAAATAAGMMAIFFILMIPVLIVLVVMIISLWKVFQKAGQPGWAAIVPVYNEWVLFEIVGYPGWWALLSFVPFVNFFPAVMAMISYYKLAKLFGKSDGFAICNIFFSYVTMPILAFGKSQFMGTPAVPAAAPAAPYVPATPVASATPVAPVTPVAPAAPVTPETPIPQPDNSVPASDDNSQQQTPPQPPLVQ